MDKSRRLPPLGAPSSRAPTSSEPPFAPLTFVDSRSPPPSQQQQQQQQHQQQPRQPQHSLSHSQLPARSLPTPPTTTPTPLFPSLSTTAQRSSQPSPPIPVSSEAAISKPKKLHREVEQRRRMRMTEQIEELRHCVSDPNSGKTDKVSILQDAVAFVKAAKRTIHSLQFKLQAAESECARLVAILTELQPNLLRQQPHHSAAPLSAHPHVHHVPSASSLLASTSAHASATPPQLLPSNAPVRAPSFNFESVVSHTSFRGATAAGATPTTDTLHAPVAQQAASWNTLTPSAQPFSHPAVSVSSHHTTHFPHAIHRSHSQPVHASLPHLRATHHQQQHQSFVGAHTGAHYAPLRNSLPRSEPPSQLEQHPQLPHPSHIEPAHTHRHAQGQQSAAAAHPGDHASIPSYKGRRHL
eukprot:TRINITY_DN1070_c0_g1_i1.p1 TRINITY_DN1070_c0_g1~~TRINITY_DN1070_c0_g1_i1.p1  ORF type:complete len:411 (-),score=78.60 TRINITY_DN1070_c0_g1_i1:267-1499(-)